MVRGEGARGGGKQTAKAPDRQSQQQKALAFKAEKQAQGKFGGIQAQKDTTVVPSADTPAQQKQIFQQRKREQQIQQGLIQPAQIQSLTQVKPQVAKIENAPKVEVAKLTETIPQAEISQDTPLRERIRESIAGVLETGGAEILRDETGKAIPATEEQQRELITKTLLIGASAQVGLTGAVSASERFLNRISKLTTPRTLKSYLTKLPKPRAGTVPLNPKNGGMVKSLLQGVGLPLTLIGLYDRAMNDRATDLAESALNDVESLVTKIRTEAETAKDPAVRASLWEEVRLTEDIRNQLLADQDKISQTTGIFENILGLKGMRLSDTSVASKKAQIPRREKLNQYLREKSEGDLSDKDFLDRIDRDKKTDLELVQSQFKSQIESVQSQITRAEKEDLDPSYYEKIEAELNAQKATEEQAVIEFYEGIRREFYSDLVDKKNLISKYSPYIEFQRQPKDLSQFD